MRCLASLTTWPQSIAASVSLASWMPTRCQWTQLQLFWLKEFLILCFKLSDLLFFLCIDLPGDFAHLTDLWNLWWTLSNSIPSRHRNWYSSSLQPHRLGQLHIRPRQWMLRCSLCFLLFLKSSQLSTLNITSCRWLWLSSLTLESTDIDDSYSNWMLLYISFIFWSSYISTWY